MEEAATTCSGLCKTILECTMKPFQPIHYAFQPYGYARSLNLVKGSYHEKSLIQGMVFVTCKVDKVPMSQRSIEYLFAKYLRHRGMISYRIIDEYKLEVHALDKKNSFKLVECFLLDEHTAIHWIAKASLRDVRDIVEQ